MGQLARTLALLQVVVEVAGGGDDVVLVPSWLTRAPRACDLVAAQDAKSATTSEAVRASLRWRRTEERPAESGWSGARATANSARLALTLIAAPRRVLQRKGAYRPWGRVVISRTCPLLPICGSARWISQPSVDPDLGADRNEIVRPDPVDRIVAEPNAAVGDGVWRNIGVAAEGAPAVEEPRPPQLARTVDHPAIDPAAAAEPPHRCVGPGR